MADRTRELGLALQGGVRDAREWQWGPFSLHKIEFPHATTYQAALDIKWAALIVSITVR